METPGSSQETKAKRSFWRPPFSLPRQSRLFGEQQPDHHHPTVTNLRSRTEGKVIGLKQYGLDKSTKLKRELPVLRGEASASGDSKIGLTRLPQHEQEISVEDIEEEARKKAIQNPFKLMYLGNLAAFRVMVYYLVTLETVLTTALTVGLTIYWYLKHEDKQDDWSGSGLDFILLSFAVISPISAAVGMAFTRRERALVTIATVRSSAYHVYLAHSLWDWKENGGREAATEVDWLSHCDAVLAQLIGIGDELSRFLSLPATSRSRHRMTKAGRVEASRTTEVAYHLLESMNTQRITRLTLYSERLKKIGLPSGEISRIRQYERYLSDGLEQLRMVKMYRTPQALRSFARLFTVLLPPFYAPAFAQVAIDTDSLGIGIVNGIIVALALTGLFLSLEALEDPFTAFLALDGIDVREEFEVLYFAQLIHTRDLVFPFAPPYPPGRRAALTARRFTRDKGAASPPPSIGQPPIQEHHRTTHSSVPGDIPSMIEMGSVTDMTVQEEKPTDILSESEYADAELGRPLLETQHHSRDSAFAFDTLFDSMGKFPRGGASLHSESTGKRSNRM